MTSLTPDIVDLRSQLLHIKRQFGDSKSENTILKVKIRRMQEELLRKNKDLQALLDPQKAINRKVVAEQGTSLILKLRDQIEDLKTQLLSRDFHIKKLQNQLIAKRVYDKNAFLTKNVCDDVRSVGVSNDNIKNNINNLDVYLHTAGDDCIDTNSPSPVSEFSYALSNLQKNISKIKENCDAPDEKPCNTVNMEDFQYTSLSRSSNDVKSPQLAHQDLENLTSYVLQMTLELENLKTNFLKLQRDKLNRSKSAEPKLGTKFYSPKLIVVQPKGSKESKASNGVINETKSDKLNQPNGKFAIKSAFAEKKSKNKTIPLKGLEKYQQTPYCGECQYVEDVDSVSEIIVLEM